MEVVLEVARITIITPDGTRFNPTFRGSRSGRVYFRVILKQELPVSILLFVEVVLEAWRVGCLLPYGGQVSILLFVEVVLEVMTYVCRVMIEGQFQSYFSWKSFWKPVFCFFSAPAVYVSILLFVEVVLEVPL